MMSPHHLIIGPEQHGVVRHALRIARSGGGHVIRRNQPDLDPESLRGLRVITHFTDRILGSDAVSAAERFCQILSATDRVITVLHDLPAPSDGHAAVVRKQGYRQVISRSDVVVMSSHHELALARDLGASPSTVVLPLPLDRWNWQRPKDSGSRLVASLGFLYPGKGTEELIEAVSEIPGRPAVVNLGRTSAGHEYLADEMKKHARVAGVDWRATGWLSDDQLKASLLDVAVPVANHRHISASASINSWIEAGRRPIVTESSYTQELADRLPQAVRLIPDTREALAAAISAALAEPESTWIPAEVTVGPTSSEVATALEAL